MRYYIIGAVIIWALLMGWYWCIVRSGSDNFRR